MYNIYAEVGDWPTDVETEVWLLGRANGANWEYRENGADEIIAEGVSVGDTIDVVALGAEVWVGQVVEHHHPYQEQGKDDGHCNGDKAALFGTVPLSDDDVGHKDKGCRETEEESSDL